MIGRQGDLSVSSGFRERIRFRFKIGKVGPGQLKLDLRAVCSCLGRDLNPYFGDGVQVPQAQTESGLNTICLVCRPIAMNGTGLPCRVSEIVTTPRIEIPLNRIPFPQAIVGCVISLFLVTNFTVSNV